jgi:hypothetical protein
MSKISQKITNSLLNKKPFKSGIRDKVTIDDIISTYYLNNLPLISLDNVTNSHIIIKHNQHTNKITLRRINDILKLLTNNKYSVICIKGIYYLLNSDGVRISIINDTYTVYYDNVF